MNEIDTILQDIATTSEGASSAVATIKTQIDTLSTTVQNLNNIVETAVADVSAMQTTVDAQETRLDGVEADLITQNNLIKTLSDTVVAMQSTVSSLNNRVGVMEDSVSAMGVNVSALQTAIAGITSDVSALDARVTALEQGGTGGTSDYVSTDLFDSTKYTIRSDSYTGTSFNLVEGITRIKYSATVHKPTFTATNISANPLTSTALIPSQINVAFKLNNIVVEDQDFTICIEGGDGSSTSDQVISYTFWINVKTDSYLPMGVVKSNVLNASNLTYSNEVVEVTRFDPVA